MSQVADSIKSLERAISRDDLSFDDGIELMSANLHELGEVADAIRKRQVGN